MQSFRQGREALTQLRGTTRTRLAARAPGREGGFPGLPGFGAEPQFRFARGAPVTPPAPPGPSPVSGRGQVWLSVALTRGFRVHLLTKVFPDPPGAYSSAGEISRGADTPGRSMKHDRRVGRGLAGEEFTVRDQLGLEACLGRLSERRRQLG